jgi:hypothetical protein
MKTDEAERDRGNSGLNRVEEALYGVVLENTVTDGVVSAPQGQKVADFVRRLHFLAVTDTTRVDFWRRPVDWADLVREITVVLIEDDICAPEQATALADALFEIIKANRSRIPRPDATTRRR